MLHSQKFRFWRTVSQCLAVGFALALITFGCFQLGLGITTPAFLYLIVIVLVSLRGSFLSSAIISLIAFGCLVYYFTPPVLNFQIETPQNLIAIIAFLTTSGVITHLVSRAEDEKTKSRLIINKIPAITWTARPDGQLDFTSQRWLDYVGLTLEERLGEKRDIAAQGHPDDREQVRRKWRWAVAEGTPFETERRIRRFDGEYRWFMARAFPLYDRAGSLVAWYGNEIDIHDRRQAEETLRRSNAYLAESQSLIRAGSWAWDACSETIFVSPELLHIFAFDIDEKRPPKRTIIEVRDLLFGERVHPHDRCSFEKLTNKAISENTDWEFDHRIVLPNGSIRFVHTVARPVFNDTGDLVEYVGTIMDVTERKRA